MKDIPVLFNMTLAQLESFVLGAGQPRFRAKQIMDWLERGAPDFSVMKNIPADLRALLDSTAKTLPLKIIKKLDSVDGQTTKFLFELSDGGRIETVLMRTSYGNSVCVSSQVGCAMGCRFCASTLLGLSRNLTSAEMISQVLAAQWELRTKTQGKETIPPNGDPNNNDVSHIVVMGTGEPLGNTENLFGFLEYANSKLGISWRRMTVSTCGIVPGIKAMTEWGRPVNLAISLHAPDDELREQIMPIAKSFSIREILDAAYEQAGKHNRQLMIEYILLGGTIQESAPILSSPPPTHEKVPSPPPHRGGNSDLKSDAQNLSSGIPARDCPPYGGGPTAPFRASGGGSDIMKGFTNSTPEHAIKLAELLSGKLVMVNLIPWNAVNERDFSSPSGNAVHRFQDILIKNGIHTRIRKERGADIQSACGQLRI